MFAGSWIKFLFVGTFNTYRFPDTSTRIAWQEALANALLQHKCANAQQAAMRRAWVLRAVEGDGLPKGRGVLASALVDSSAEDSPSGALLRPLSPKKLSSAFTGFGRGGKAAGAGSPAKERPSHFHRLMKIRSETSMQPFGASAGTNHYGKAGFVPSAPPSPQQSPQIQKSPQVGKIDIEALTRLSSGSSPGNLGRKRLN